MLRVNLLSWVGLSLFILSPVRPGCCQEGSTESLCLKRIAVLGDARLRHADQVTAIVPLADGKRLLSSSRDRTVRLWEMESGQELRRFVHSDSSWCVDVRPGRETCISTGGKKELFEWDLATGEVVRQLTGHEKTVFRCAVSPDGTRLISGDGGPEAFEWRLTGDLEVLRRFKVGGKDDAVYGTAWSPDGKRFALAGQQKQIWLFDADSGECLKKLPKVSKDLYTLQFSPDGTRLISTSGDNTVRMWRVEGGEEAWAVNCGEDVHIAAFSPDGALVAAGVEDGSVRVLNASDGKERLKIDTRGDGIWPVAFSRDGRYVLAGGSCLIRRFDVATGKRLFPPADYVGPCTPLKSVVMAPRSDRLICSSESDKAVFVYDVRTARVVARWENDQGLGRLVLSSDGRRAFARDRGKVAAWDVDSGKLLWTSDTGGHPDEMAVSHDGGRVVLLDSNEQRILDGSTGKELRKVNTSREGGGYAQHMVVSPDGQMAVACHSEGVGAIYRLPELTVAGHLSLPVKEPKPDAKADPGAASAEVRAKYVNIRDGAILPHSGVLLMVDDDKTLRQWRPRIDRTVRMTDAETRRAVKELNDESFSVRQDAMRRLIACGEEIRPVLESVRTEDDQGFRQAVESVRRSLATRLLPTRMLPQVLQFEHHVSCLVGHPDGVHWAAVEGYGTKSLVLGRATPEGLAVVARVEDPNLPNDIAFSTDGRFLYAVNGNCTISVYRLTAGAVGEGEL